MVPDKYTMQVFSWRHNEVEMNDIGRISGSVIIFLVGMLIGVYMTSYIPYGSHKPIKKPYKYSVRCDAGKCDTIYYYIRND
jgi:hypothetical protein